MARPSLLLLDEPSLGIAPKLAQQIFQAIYEIAKQGLTILCLLYTSDAADERSSVDLGGRRIIKKKKKSDTDGNSTEYNTTSINKIMQMRCNINNRHDHQHDKRPRSNTT